MTVRRAPPHNPDLCLWGVGQAHRVLASAKCREDEVQRRRLQVEAQELKTRPGAQGGCWHESCQAQRHAELKHGQGGYSTVVVDVAAL